ncbi:MAG: acylphosphatase [Planctomycetota bacterium]|nr:acylphosphatase [Planctomycetota bacterium]
MRGIEARFTGSVQGVGFRWTTKRLAEAAGLGGWVRNNPDGSVTLAVRGESEAIECLLNELGTRLGPAVASVESREIPAGTVPEGFEIVR